MLAYLLLLCFLLSMSWACVLTVYATFNKGNTYFTKFILHSCTFYTVVYAEETHTNRSGELFLPSNFIVMQLKIVFTFFGDCCTKVAGNLVIIRPPSFYSNSTAFQSLEKLDSIQIVCFFFSKEADSLDFMQFEIVLKFSSLERRSYHWFAGLLRIPLWMKWGYYWRCF